MVRRLFHDAGLLIAEGVQRGAFNDLDGPELAALASRVIAVRAVHPRAMAPQRIAEAFEKRNIDAEMADDVAGALERAMAATGESGLICVSGSLFVAAEARAHVLACLPEGRYRHAREVRAWR